MAPEWVKKRCCYFPRAKKWRNSIRIVEEREDIRVREDMAKLLDDFLATSHSEQPVVNNGAPHQGSGWLKRLPRVLACCNAGQGGEQNSQVE
jgi:hypothetical protein